MRSKQDGTGIPPYAAETAAEISKLGNGGRGNSESLMDAEEKGVTPQLIAETAKRAERAISGEVPPSHNIEKPHDDARIGEIAYSIWLKEGQPHGRDLDHWFQAERINSTKR
ncbi:hypothetical protein GCM10007874_35720 [Labrys miyagiensis]|uniref:DUF2934 domain-containing protein n=1 Tax=Labrys miyagiensis TaxID=346912 RepID=A0ABQ6CK53_9HYPH|nr:DUF2934 domain-containing protein [Labrys miyagiensis]GLS20555.1 hypothetical protein GCM10007874_35720 [Labrys miyagiensis]